MPPVPPPHGQGRRRGDRPPRPHRRGDHLRGRLGCEGDHGRDRVHRAHPRGRASAALRLRPRRRGRVGLQRLRLGRSHRRHVLSAPLARELDRRRPVDARPAVAERALEPHLPRPLDAHLVRAARALQRAQQRRLDLDRDADPGGGGGAGHLGGSRCRPGERDRGAAQRRRGEAGRPLDRVADRRSDAPLPGPARRDLQRAVRLRTAECLPRRAGGPRRSDPSHRGHPAARLVPGDRPDPAQLPKRSWWRRRRAPTRPRP